MEPFGPIAEVSRVTVRGQPVGMPATGLWVKFAFFQDCKDAIWVSPRIKRSAGGLTQNHQNLQQSDNYRLHVTNPDIKPAQPYSNGTPTSAFGLRSSSDAKSIFLGGLPENVYDQQLRNIFVPFGTIDMVTIMRKPCPREFVPACSMIHADSMC